jgi:hypothetical protein
MTKVQDLIIKDYFENDDDNQTNEMVQILEFTRDHGTPLTKDQLLSFVLLKENGLSDISDFAFSMKKHITPVRLFFEMVSKITMADRIKGSAKLSHLMKATANPAGNLKPEDIQAKGMSKKEIGG